MTANDWDAFEIELKEAHLLARSFQENLVKNLLLNLIPKNKELVEQCQIRLKAHILEFDCPNSEVAVAMSDCVETISFGIWQLAEFLRLERVPKASISVRGLQIFPAWHPCRFLQNIFKIQTSAAFPLPNNRIDFEFAFYDECPIYVTEMGTQIIKYANPAALRANQKEDTPEKMIGKDCLALWDDLPLLCIEETLPNAGTMSAHSYPGLRWFKDEQNRSWRRHRMIFVSDYQFLSEYEGSYQPHRFCRIKQAVRVEEVPPLIQVS